MQKAVCTVAASIVAIAVVCVFALIPHIDNNDSGHTEEFSLSEEAELSESQIEEDSSNNITPDSVDTSVVITSNNVVESVTTAVQKETEYNDIMGYAVPYGKGSFKSYTNYQLLSKSSPQWTKIQCNSNAYTDENGLRKVGDYYCVAMGSYYSRTLGDLFEIQTEGGSFKVIICDFKSDYHTDGKNQYTSHNDCVVEFYVDMSQLNSVAKQMGDISYVDSNFKGQILGITKLGNYFS